MSTLKNSNSLHSAAMGVRLRPDERQALEGVASRFGTTIGGFMRTAAIMVAGELEPETKDLTLNRSLAAPALTIAAKAAGRKARGRRI